MITTVVLSSMDRRARRQERRRQRRNRRAGQRRGQSGGKRNWTRYKMTQKLVAIGDDYYVENEVGEQVFVIDGKALRVRNTLRMSDLQTGDEYRIQEKIARVMNTMTIRKNGERAAAVKKAVVSPIRDRFTILIPGMPNVHVAGNVLDHEYRMTSDGEPVAEVSKQWFRVRDAYGIEVAPGMDAGLVVACTVALDMMVNPAR